MAPEIWRPFECSWVIRRSSQQRGIYASQKGRIRSQLVGLSMSDIWQTPQFALHPLYLSNPTLSAFAIPCDYTPRHATTESVSNPHSIDVSHCIASLAMVGKPRSIVVPTLSCRTINESEEDTH